jgi:hypothetical protein
MRVAALLMLLLLLLPATAHAQRLRYRGCERLPEKKAAGLSGITHAGDGTYWGVLEWEAKLVRLRIKTRRDGSLESVAIDRTVPVPKGSDFEGIAWTSARPEAVTVSTEAPEIVEVSLKDGRRMRSIKLPPTLSQTVRNQGLESLTYSTDGKSLWTANERALKGDGNPMTPATPMFSATRVRLQRYDVTPDAITPAEQYEYQTSGVHDLAGQIGLCDVAALPDGRLLALERSAAQNLSGAKSIRTRIYLVDVTGATDIGKPPFDAGLVNQTPVKVAKTLLYDGFVCDADGENFEGLCLGPKLSPGRWQVIGVVDNTDGGVGVSKPAVIAFELDLNAPPATQPSTHPASNVNGAK